MIYDPADGIFKTSPAGRVMALAAGTGDEAGNYFATLADTPSVQFLPGDYVKRIHDTASANVIKANLPAVMHDAGNGQADDATVFPSGAGVTLAADGLDAVTTEPGINARQAISVIMAAVEGILSGAGTGTVTVKDPAGTATRAVIECDQRGNRTRVILSPPA